MFPTNAIFCCRFGSLFTYHLVANNVNKEKIDCVRPFHKLLIKPVRAKLACYYSSVHGFNFRERCCFSQFPSGGKFASSNRSVNSRADHWWKNWGRPLKHQQKSLFDGIDDGICYAFDLSTIITLGSSYYTCAFYSFINFIMLFSWHAVLQSVRVYPEPWWDR